MAAPRSAQLPHAEPSGTDNHTAAALAHCVAALCVGLIGACVPCAAGKQEALYWQLVPPVKNWVSGERCIDNDAGCVPSDEHVLPPPRLPPSNPLLPPALHASASSACYHTAETCGAHARASAKGLLCAGLPLPLVAC